MNEDPFPTFSGGLGVSPRFRFPGLPPSLRTGAGQ